MISDRVYVMKGEGRCKIGLSSFPVFREQQLNYENIDGKAYKLVFTSEAHDTARRTEKLCHKLLANKRIKGEWFAVSVDEAIETVNQAYKIVTEEPEKHTEETIEAIKKIKNVFPKHWKEYKYSRAPVVLNKEEMASLLNLKHILEEKHNKMFNMASVVRFALEQLAVSENLIWNKGDRRN